MNVKAHSISDGGNDNPSTGGLTPPLSGHLLVAHKLHRSRSSMGDWLTPASDLVHNAQLKPPEAVSREIESLVRDFNAVTTERDWSTAIFTQ